MDPSDGFVLGPCALKTWSREPTRCRIRHRKDRKKIPAEEKEIFRWIECAHASKKVLSKVNKVTVIGDREFDFYAAFHQIADDKTDILMRAKSKRRVLINEAQVSLDEFVSQLNIQDVRRINVLCRSSKKPKRKPTEGMSSSQRKQRIANLELKYGAATILRPKEYYDKEAPASLRMYVIEVAEKSCGEGETPIKWRLLTSHTIDSVKRAWEIVDWYKKRWTIEQLFRTAKRGGFDTEGIEITKGESIEKLVTMMMFASIKVMQLTMARTDANERKAHFIFQDDELRLIKKLNQKYEGKTAKQKNPYTPLTLAWCAWVIARIGGWKGYSSEGPPGPTTMMRGLRSFAQIYYGWSFAQDVCIS